MKWSRVRLILSILACEGLFSTLRERIQWSALSDNFETGDSAERSCPELHDYAGVLHIHSTHSDGVGTIPEIAAAGKRAGVDFILMCDHSTLDAIEQREDGWYENCLVLVGTEVTTDSGHVLAIGVPPDFLPTGMNAESVQASAQALGGSAVIALPCDLKDHWQDFSRRIPGVGLEVFNFSAIARNKINIPALALIWRRYRGKRPLRAFHLVSARPRRELRLWDDTASHAWNTYPQTKVIGLASLDAHAVMRFGGREYPYPTYEEVFRTLRTHVLTPTAIGDGSGRRDTTDHAVQNDIRAVESALASGHSYMAYDNYALADGFQFWASVCGNYVCGSGDTLELKSESANGNEFDMHVRVPARKGIVRLYMDGIVVSAGRGKNIRFSCQGRGVYRVEVFLYKFRIGPLCFGSKPWIFSNHIYVR